MTMFIRSKSSLRNWGLMRPLTILLALFKCCVGSSYAHQSNVTQVGLATLGAANQHCDDLDSQFDPSVLCDILPDNNTAPTLSELTQLSHFAPDKLVMQSVAGLSSVRRQVSVVGGRLGELHQKRIGMNPFGAPGGEPTLHSRTSSTQTTTSAIVGAGGGSAGVGASGQQSGTGATSAPPSSSSQDTDLQGEEGASGQGLLTAGSAAFPSTDYGAYVRVEGDRGEVDPTSFDPGFDSRSAGLTVGADYKVSTNTVVGAALSYADNRSALDTSDGSPSGNVKTRGGSLSIYGAYYPTASTYLDATLVYGRSRYESIRNISIPGVADSAVGRSDGRQYGLSLGGGYSFLASNFNFGPYARVSLSKAKVDAFTEQENSTATNLAVQAQTAESLVGVLGGQISYAISRDWGVLVPNVRFEWEHQHKDDRTRNLLASFSQIPSATTINIETTPPDSNYFNLGLGVASHFGVGRSMFIYYQTVLGKAETSSHAITAELRLEF